MFSYMRDVLGNVPPAGYFTTVTTSTEPTQYPTLSEISDAVEFADRHSLRANEKIWRQLYNDAVNAILDGDSLANFDAEQEDNAEDDND